MNTIYLEVCTGYKCECFGGPDEEKYYFFEHPHQELLDSLQNEHQSEHQNEHQNEHLK